MDTWLTYSKCTKTTETQKEFYLALSEELIDNTYDSGRLKRNISQISSEHSPTIK